MSDANTTTTPDTPAGGAVAWLDDVAGECITSGRKHDWLLHYGHGGIKRAEKFDVPLVRADATVPLDAVLALVGQMDEFLDAEIEPELDTIQKWRDELEALTRGEGK